jgi:conjugal transfer pilus assembly protein TraW
MAVFRSKQGTTRLVAAVVLALAFCVPAWAADAALGTVYPIAERDLLEVIQERLQAKQDSGELAALQQQMVQSAKDKVENPPPIAGISTATKPSTHWYDPTVTAPNDIRDTDGNVVVKAGTTVNPLDYMGLNKVLLFIDARDQRQVAWADHEYHASPKPVKTVLVAGSYMALMRQWQRPVYYDQAGYLCQRLGIAEVPAKVWQEKPSDTELRIDTLVLAEGKGDKP